VTEPKRDARAELVPAAGLVAADVASELPGLRLRWVTVPAGSRASPPALVQRLKDLSDRYRGGVVVTMRTKPIAQAFRAFFRQIGLDPDVRRIPSEDAAVMRLLHGEFRSVDLVTDACLVALVETGVPVWALDAALVGESGLGIRTTIESDSPWPDDATYLEPGSLVVADVGSVHAVLFADPLPGHGVSARTTEVALFSLAVDGVPEIHVEEALWCAVELVCGGG
jgi:DNA/RNA-binding domain of Phe-tRNA-synthetase-like protein